MFKSPWPSREAPRNLPHRWRKMKKRNAGGPEFFLRRLEPWYVGACGRFLSPGSGKNQLWFLGDREEQVSALLLYSRRTLFPVFRGRTDIPLVRFVRRFFRMTPLHAVQGLRKEVQALETAFAELEFPTVDIIDYDLMALDTEPANFRGGPPGLSFRRPGVMDTDALFELQAAYEKEEILPRGSVFNPAVCRLNLQRILTEEQFLAAEIDGHLVGKINTSAHSFTRCQIGGVYVHPDYRGLGIARRMTAEFLRSLMAEGWGITLFVKKKNAAARAVYQSLGFRFLEDYRISYY